jgi:hypothetical protein
MHSFFEGGQIKHGIFLQQESVRSKARLFKATYDRCEINLKYIWSRIEGRIYKINFFYTQGGGTGGIWIRFIARFTEP